MFVVFVDGELLLRNHYTTSIYYTTPAFISTKTLSFYFLYEIKSHFKTLQYMTINQQNISSLQQS